MPSLTTSLPNTPSPICLGTCGYGSELETEACFRLFDRYVELGGNFIDTAHCYDFWIPGGLGKPERVLGEWLRRSGASVIVATKGGHPDAGPDYPRPERFLAPDVISTDVDESLERLGLDSVDLYYLHRDDGKTPVAEIVDALNVEVDRGRVRSLGASNWTPDRIAQANAYAVAHGKHGFVASQPQWSLGVPSWDPGSDPTMRYVTEEDRLAYKASGLTVVAYSATSNGYFGSNGERGGSFKTEANAERLARVQKMAKERGVSENQIALAWLLNQDLPVITIIGTRSLSHLEDAMSAPEITLEATEVAWLRDGDAA